MPSADYSEFIVKICGITNEADARAATEAGATAIGLNFYRRSPRFVTAASARAIAIALPGSMLKVGVFVNTTADDIRAIAEQAALDVVQLHGSAPGDLRGLRVWRAVPVDDRFPESLNGLEDAEAFLVDAPTKDYGGSGQTFDWSRTVGLSRRIVLAGGLDASNVSQAISTVNPWGVDACSRLESAPGKKDAQKIRRFVAEALHARAEATRLSEREPFEQELLS
jgi:phosphoribosylanthranilate isomerase